MVNYTDIETPYTRIIEHKHFEFGKQDTTVISREYQANGIWERSILSINDEKNSERYRKYAELAAKPESSLEEGWECINILTCRIR